MGSALSRRHVEGPFPTVPQLACLVEYAVMAALREPATLQFQRRRASEALPGPQFDVMDYVHECGRACRFFLDGVGVVHQGVSAKRHGLWPGARG